MKRGHPINIWMVLFKFRRRAKPRTDHTEWCTDNKLEPKQKSGDIKPVLLLFTLMWKFLHTLSFKLSRRATNHLTIVKYSILLDWQCRFIKNFWSYKHKTPGRKPVSKGIKKLILQMKQENQLWGCHRVADELKKLGIILNPTIVNRIIQTYRKQGKIHPNGSWKRFLKANWDSLFGMDFMTIYTLLGKRFYLLIILELKSRRIIRFDLTENPCREFVKQRIELFSEDLPEK